MPGHEAGARQQVAALPGVSRETLESLDDYVRELSIWQNRINLVSPNTVSVVWERHILDCAQLILHRGDARIWLDMGSGAGLPGIVLACLFKGLQDGSHVHLVESNRKKAAFLHHMIGRLTLPATVHSDRVEDVVERIGKIDIVTARALAPLADLLGLSNLLLKKGAKGLFLKGQDAENELTEAAKHWQFYSRLLPSVTDPASRIVSVTWMSAN